MSFASTSFQATKAKIISTYIRTHIYVRVYKYTYAHERGGECAEKRVGWWLHEISRNFTLLSVFRGAFCYAFRLSCFLSFAARSLCLRSLLWQEAIIISILLFKDYFNFFFSRGFFYFSFLPWFILSLVCFIF